MPPAFAALHADATRLIGSWSAPDPHLAQLRERFLQVLHADPTAVWRSGPPVHLTASLVVLSPGLDAVALTLHGKAKRWFQFGGHVEAGDASMADAALREGREESGLDGLRLLPGLLQLDAHTLPSAFGRCREHLDVRFAAVAETAVLTCSNESDEVRWWPLDALPPDLEPALRDAVDLALERARSGH